MARHSLEKIFKPSGLEMGAIFKLIIKILSWMGKNMYLILYIGMYSIYVEVDVKDNATFALYWDFISFKITYLKPF